MEEEGERGGGGSERRVVVQDGLETLRLVLGTRPSLGSRLVLSSSLVLGSKPVLGSSPEKRKKGGSVGVYSENRTCPYRILIFESFPLKTYPLTNINILSVQLLNQVRFSNM